MGIFVTVDQRDYQTLSENVYDVEEVYPDKELYLPGGMQIRVRFREYELYEKVWPFRSTTEKHQIIATAEAFSPPMGTHVSVVEQQSAWRAEETEQKDITFQVRAVTSRLGEKLDERYQHVEDFEEAVTVVIDDE